LQEFEIFGRFLFWVAMLLPHRCGSRFKRCGRRFGLIELEFTFFAGGDFLIMRAELEGGITLDT
jgi:hypothetical protein